MSTIIVIDDDTDEEPHEKNETNETKKKEGSNSKLPNGYWMTKLQQASTDIQNFLHHNEKQKNDMHDKDNKDKDDNGDNGKTIESVEYIPAMINQILKETSSEIVIVSSSELADTTRQSVRNVAMVEFIISVVLGFTQCFIHDLTMKEKQQQLQQQNENANNKIHGIHSKNDIIQKSKKRLFAWVSDTILELLNNNDGGHSNNSSGNGNSGASSARKSCNQSRIPVLDALLATTGEHNGKTHDVILQETIIGLVPNLSSSTATANIETFEEQDISTKLRNDFYSNRNETVGNKIEDSIDLNPRDFCERISKENEHLESMQNEGNSVEHLCSNNLFLRQMQSFISNVPKG